MGSAVWLAILCLGVAEAIQSSDPSLDFEWQEWKIKYNKIYSLVSNMNTILPDLMENSPYWYFWCHRGHRDYLLLSNCPKSWTKDSGWWDFLFLVMWKMAFFCSVLRLVLWPLAVSTPCQLVDTFYYKEMSYIMFISRRKKGRREQYGKKIWNWSNSIILNMIRGRITSLWRSTVLVIW